MLGLSLLGLGSSARGGQTSQLPKKIKNLRQKEQEQLKAEDQKLLTMIESEARTTIAEEEQQRQIQELQQKRQQDSLSKLNIGQKIFRYSVLGVWTVAAGLFFSSLIFNAPMSLGKKVLSALPGNPHTAVMKMELSDQAAGNGKMTVDLSLDSDNYPVQFVKALITFEATKLDFLGYQIGKDRYSEVKIAEAKTDKEGKKALEIILKPEEERILKNDKIVQLNFETIKGGEIAKVDFYQPDCLVISKNQDGENNILGRVAGVKFLTKEPEARIKVQCQNFDENENPNNAGAWQSLINGRLIPDEENYWQEIDNESSFVCAKKAGKIYLLLVQLFKSAKPISGAAISFQNEAEDGLDKNNSSKIFSWKEKDVEFSVFEFNLKDEEINKKNFFVEFSGENYIVKWPSAGGFGRIEIKK